MQRDETDRAIRERESASSARMATAVGPGPIRGPDDVPGEPTKTMTMLKERGASVMQSLKPISRIHQHLCAFHFYAYDMRRQVEAHHYCTHYNEDVHQCAIFDSDKENARLIGVEYIVTEKLFKSLPDEEKKLWHSHEYEVKSGVLFLPGIPQPIEHSEMKMLAKTYGKVFHFWQFDRGDSLPLGPPQLMMALTADGQLQQELAADVEKRYDVSFAEKRKNREDLEGPEGGVHSLSNSWTSGKGLASAIRPVESCEGVFQSVHL
ncbi:hypothetical protein R1flu_021825 [Riccia fluitans]|uniref:Oil body-associated protein 1A n=1 Tax=Riccia fluitans TaxID=41844 RepID=A0ABD1ZR41_9MARC